jgi:hypothetical protein
MNPTYKWLSVNLCFFAELLQSFRIVGKMACCRSLEEDSSARAGRRAADLFAGKAGGVVDMPKLVCRPETIFSDPDRRLYVRRLCYLSSSSGCSISVVVSNLLCCFSLPRTSSSMNQLVKTLRRDRARLPHLDTRARAFRHARDYYQCMHANVC